MNANNPNGWGGAIHSMGKNTIVIDNCTFKDNFAEDGGAIHAWGNLYIKNSLFIDNEWIGLCGDETNLLTLVEFHGRFPLSWAGCPAPYLFF